MARPQPFRRQVPPRTAKRRLKVTLSMGVAETCLANQGGFTLSLPLIHPRLPSGSIHDGVRRNIVVRLFSRALGLEQVAWREHPSLKTDAFGHCCSS